MSLVSNTSTNWSNYIDRLTSFQEPVVVDSETTSLAQEYSDIFVTLKRLIEELPQNKPLKVEEYSRALRGKVIQIHQFYSDPSKTGIKADQVERARTMVLERLCMRVQYFAPKVFDINQAQYDITIKEVIEKLPVTNENIEMVMKAILKAVEDAKESKVDPQQVIKHLDPSFSKNNEFLNALSKIIDKYNDYDSDRKEACDSYIYPEIYEAFKARFRKILEFLIKDPNFRQKYFEKSTSEKPVVRQVVTRSMKETTSSQTVQEEPLPTPAQIKAISEEFTDTQIPRIVEMFRYLRDVKRVPLSEFHGLQNEVKVCFIKAFVPVSGSSSLREVFENGAQFEDIVNHPPSKAIIIINNAEKINELRDEGHIPLALLVELSEEKLNVIFLFHESLIDQRSFQSPFRSFKFFAALPPQELRRVLDYELYMDHQHEFKFHLLWALTQGGINENTTYLDLFERLNDSRKQNLLDNAYDFRNRLEKIAKLSVEDRNRINQLLTLGMPLDALYELDLPIIQDLLRTENFLHICADLNKRPPATWDEILEKYAKYGWWPTSILPMEKKKLAWKYATGFGELVTVCDKNRNTLVSMKDLQAITEEQLKLVLQFNLQPVLQLLKMDIKFPWIMEILNSDADCFMRLYLLISTLGSFGKQGLEIKHIEALHPHLRRVLLSDPDRFQLLLSHFPYPDILNVDHNKLLSFLNIIRQNHFDMVVFYSKKFQLEDVCDLFITYTYLHRVRITSLNEKNTKIFYAWAELGLNMHQINALFENEHLFAMDPEPFKKNMLRMTREKRRSLSPELLILMYRNPEIFKLILDNEKGEDLIANQNLVIKLCREPEKFQQFLSSKIPLSDLAALDQMKFEVPLSKVSAFISFLKIFSIKYLKNLTSEQQSSILNNFEKQLAIYQAEQYQNLFHSEQILIPVSQEKYSQVKHSLDCHESWDEIIKDLVSSQSNDLSNEKPSQTKTTKKSKESRTEKSDQNQTTKKRKNSRTEKSDQNKTTKKSKNSRTEKSDQNKSVNRKKT